MSRFIKIAASGEQLPADATGHVAVLDTTTNLMWSVAPVIDDETEVDFAADEKACTDYKAAGFEDWRLPERMELESILDLTRYDPAIDPAFFPGTQSDWYWTKTPLASSPADCAWLVSFSHGHVYYHHRNHYAFVRAVRAVSASQ